MPKGERPSLRDHITAWWAWNLDEAPLLFRKRIDEPTDQSPRCPRCEYDLTGLKPAGHCPECGTVYFPINIERSRNKREKRRSTFALRMIGSLILLDLFASVPYAFSKRGWSLSTIDHALEFLFLKVVILDLMLIGVLALLLLLVGMHRKSRSRTVLKWAFVGGVIGCTVTFVAGFIPGIDDRIPSFSFGYGLGGGLFLGWFASFLRAEP